MTISVLCSQGSCVKKEKVIEQDYYLKLLKRQTILAENVSPKVAIHSTLITTFGLIQNEHFSEILELM